MTEFYNCLIFLQFFTASFTIVLTPQGCARERIFSMKEQLYTIPLNDAVNAQDECPFCFIHRSIEQDLLDFVLGSGSSYMEADIREQTDKAGFCRYHFQKMFDYGNTLGNAWILKTHYQRMIREMQQEFASFRPDLIILDPPAFAKHRDALRNALKGYRRLNAKAFEQIKPGGILFTFSCSQVVSKDQFRLAVFSWQELLPAKNGKSFI
jgi:hypothetical protein